MEEQYLQIAKKYLSKDTRHLTPNICMTIRVSDITKSKDPEQFIKTNMDQVFYDFSTVRIYEDTYGTRMLLFYNPNGKSKMHGTCEKNCLNCSNSFSEAGVGKFDILHCMEKDGVIVDENDCCNKYA